MPPKHTSPSYVTHAKEIFCTKNFVKNNRKLTEKRGHDMPLKKIKMLNLLCFALLCFALLCFVRLRTEVVM